MRYRVVVDTDVELTINSICQYIIDNYADYLAAERLRSRFVKAIYSLSFMPKVNLVDDDIYKVHVGKYIIFYQVRSDGVVFVFKLVYGRSNYKLFS